VSATTVGPESVTVGPEDVETVVPVAPGTRPEPMMWMGGSFAGSPFTIEARWGAAIEAARHPQIARYVQCFRQKLEPMKSPIKKTGAAKLNLHALSSHICLPLRKSRSLCAVRFETRDTFDFFAPLCGVRGEHFWVITSETCANRGITYAAHFDHPQRCPAFAGGTGPR